MILFSIGTVRQTNIFCEYHNHSYKREIFMFIDIRYKIFNIITFTLYVTLVLLVTIYIYSVFDY